MGRKNRNARSNSYSSFAELRNATTTFDLSRTNFIVKAKRKMKPSLLDEIGVSFSTGKKKGMTYMCLSFREDVGNTIINSFGEYWACGHVKEGVSERIYLVPNEKGFKIYSTNNGTRKYVKFPLADNSDDFMKFEGYHTLRFDDYNKAYYVLPTE